MHLITHPSATHPPAVETSAVEIRRATRQDLLFVAWCNYESTSPVPGFCYWDPLLEGFGTTTSLFIETVLRVDALAWGKVEDFFVAERDGELVGGASAFVMDIDDYRPFRLSSLPVVAESLGWTQATIDQFIQRYTGVWADAHDPTLAPQAPWIVECMAVLPELRGQSIAKHLLHAILEEGKKLGHSHAGISVTTGNLSAQRAYEAVGFQLHIAYGSEYFNGEFPGTTKYRIKL